MDGWRALIRGGVIALRLGRRPEAHAIDFVDYRVKWDFILRATGSH